MNWPVVVSLVTAVGAVAATLTKWLNDRHLASGGVGTSTAGELWTAMLGRTTALQESYDEVVKLLTSGNSAHDAIVAQLRTDLAACTEACKLGIAENKRAVAENRRLTAELRKARTR